MDMGIYLGVLHRHGGAHGNLVGGCRLMCQGACGGCSGGQEDEFDGDGRACAGYAGYGTAVGGAGHDWDWPEAWDRGEM